MIAKIEKSKIKGKINAIPSKSYAHRIAICNFLAGKEPSGKSGCFTSKDIEATERCLKDVNAGKNEVDCGESGSTLRFLLPLLAARGGEYAFIGHGKLMQRPNDELFSVLREHNIIIDKRENIKISGKLTSGDFRLRGDISSQYVSGLLMALPTLDGDSTITLTTPLSSAAYVDITLEVLRAFGIKIEKTSSGYFVKGNQKFSGDILPEGDWSNAAFFLVAGAIGEEVEVSGLNPDSVQGDKAILSVLEQAGAKVEINGDSIKVKASKLKGFYMDAENCPDLVPIVAVLAAVANGKSVIKNVERLKIKESDRIESTINTLKSFGVKAEYKDNSLVIYGAVPASGTVDSYNDHRIAMAAAVIASVSDGTTIINGADAVQKSYPDFFVDFNKLGGKAEYGC